MASIDVAKLLNKITQDIPGINTVLKALAKWDVSALTDVPDGAMQATTDTSNRLTIRKKVSGSYTPVAKLMHDVDTVDGYHASTSATANAVAVRDASGVLPGNITGNAVTADTATALATGAVVPVNQGGTGAKTASQARANLGVADGADFTTHIAKQASPSVEGHVQLDALAADGSNKAAPGGFGLGTPCVLVSDLDAIKSGPTMFFRTNTNTQNVPITALGIGIHLKYVDTTFKQLWFRLTTGDIFYRGDGDASWVRLPGGITDSTSTTSSTVAASATAVKAVNDAVAVAQNTANNAVTAADRATTKSGTSSTASGTAAKVVACSGFVLSTNARIFVTFSNANTVANALTLNVNGTGAKSVYNQTGIISATNTALFAANQPIEFRYDGTGWVFFDSEKIVTPLLAGKANVGLSNVTGNAISFYFHACDEKPSGTHGGTATGGAWQTRDINTIKKNGIDAALANNRITLRAGRYYLRAALPAFIVNTVKAAVYNVTSSSYLLYGMSSYARADANGSCIAPVEGEFTLLVDSQIELRMYPLSSAGTYGYGAALGAPGVPEVYSEVRIWKM